MSETIWKIYKTTCLVNGKVYIGQSVGTGARWKRYLGGGTMLAEAIKKYGRNNFVRETLIECYCQIDADEYEALFIELYSSCSREFGYNIIPGSSYRFGGGCPMHDPEVVKRNLLSRAGMRHSLETRKKLSEIGMGHIISPETRAKISAKLKGRSPSPEKLYKMQNVSKETRQKMSESKKGIKNHNYGKPKSDETKQKISQSNKGKASWCKGKKLPEWICNIRKEINKKNARKVEAYNILTNEIIMQFDSISEAMRTIGGSIAGCVLGKRKTAAGYHWRYSI